MSEKDVIAEYVGKDAGTEQVEFVKEIDLEARGEDQGYVLDVEVLKTLTTDWTKYLLTPDGQTVLIPQPSDDPDDPLNWSPVKKHAVLFVVSALASLPDYAGAAGAVVLTPQAMEWGTTEGRVNQATAGLAFMIGAGGVFTVVFSAYFGRLPVLFWFSLMGLITLIVTAAAPNFETFMAFRILYGFFATAAQGGGVMFIKDMFFVHERVKKINIWAWFVLASPYMGPLIAAFVSDKHGWRVAFWVNVALTSGCVIAMILFARETFYNRKIPLEQQPIHRRGLSGHISRLIGIEQWKSRRQRSTFQEAVMRSVRVLLKPTVFISSMYYLLAFAWAVGVNNTLSLFLTPLYGFGLKQVGYYYFTPVVSAVLGEVAGRGLHDQTAKWLTKRSKNGRMIPEFRLVTCSLAMPFMVVGLIVLGLALENAWHYMIAALGWGMYVFGTMITTVSLTAYNLDCYPQGSGEISAWLNMARVTGGFIITFFQVDWANAMGTTKSLGIQGAICFVAYILIVFLHFYGQRLREWSGPLRFKTD